MKYKHTIEIITKDIQDIEKLLGNFKNYSQVPNIELDLALSKLRNVYDILLLFKENSPGDSQDKPYQEPTAQDTNPPAPESGIRETKTEKFIEDKTNLHEHISEEAAKTSEAKKAIEESPEEENAPSKTEMDERKEKILGDKFGNQKFINEKIGAGKSQDDLSSRLQSGPIYNIAGSMGINDKFYYIRELFDGNAENFRKTMDTLDHTANFNDAWNFLMNNFQWDMDSQPVQQLLNLIRRKFISSGNE